MSQDWNIRARAAACAGTGQPFEDGAAVYSRLVPAEDGYIREDYSGPAWTDDLRTGALSVWKNTYRAPPAGPEPKAVRRETAESLLRQLIETDDEANRVVIFILTVMLERQRILVERDVRQQDERARVRVYEHRKTGESFLVTDPDLKLAELEAVQAEVMERLGIPPPPTAAPPPPAAEA